MTRPLENLTAVVTGSSFGYRPSDRRPHWPGGRVGPVHARSNRDGAEETRATVETYGVESRVILADLSVKEELERFADDAWAWQKRRRHPGSTTAGADILTGGAVELPFEKRLDLTLAKTDVLGTVRLSRLVGGWMKKRGQWFDRQHRLGRLPNVAWPVPARNFSPRPKAPSSRSRVALPKPWPPEVRVNCVSPGWIKTAWGEEADKAWQDRATSRIPHEPLGHPRRHRPRRPLPRRPRHILHRRPNPRNQRRLPALFAPRPRLRKKNRKRFEKHNSAKIKRGNSKPDNSSFPL